MIRFALLGCGRIARRHADILASGKINDATLVAVCDIKPDRAEDFGRRYNVPHFTDMAVMMEKLHKDIDVVCVLTESGNHAAHTIAMAGYGKHVVVEKPMALTLQDADAMIAACDSAGVKLFVVKQNRFNTPVQCLRAAVDAGRFGRKVMGTVRVRWCRDQRYYDQDEWRGTWAGDGGVFANQASHHIDLLEWLMGEPVSVYATIRTALVDIEAEDTGIAIIKFADGSLGLVEATTATRPKDLEGSVSILGEGGSAVIGGFAVNEMKVWNFVNPQQDDADVLTRYRENPPDVYGFGHTAYLNHVVESLKHGRRALVDGLEGRKSLELIAAMYESAFTNREVSLRFSAKVSPLGRR